MANTDILDLTTLAPAGRPVKTASGTYTLKHPDALTQAEEDLLAELGDRALTEQNAIDAAPDVDEDGNPDERKSTKATLQREREYFVVNLQVVTDIPESELRGMSHAHLNALMEAFGSMRQPQGAEPIPLEQRRQETLAANPQTAAAR